MKRFFEHADLSERLAWRSFEQTGEIGAYLLYCAIKKERDVRGLERNQ